MTTKDQIEAAANEWRTKQLSTSCYPQYDAPQLLANEFQAGALWMQAEMEKLIEQKIESQDFYELMQTYRHAPLTNQEQIINAFEAVKNYCKGIK